MRDHSLEPSTADGRTLTDLLDAAVKHNPDKTFLIAVGDDEELTYRELHRRSGAVAAELQAAGVERGDRVVVALPSCVELALILLACARLGVAFGPINPDAPASEVVGLVRQARPRIVVTRQSTSWMAAALADASMGDIPIHDARALCSGNSTPPPVAAAPTDTLLLIATSGSTSAPKLVAQHQTGVVLAAEGFPAWLGLEHSDRLLSPLPLFHGNVLNYSLLGALAAKASLVLLPSFSASRFWSQVREYGATQFNAMGVMGEVLLRAPERPDDHDNPVRICYSAWALAAERHLEFEHRFGLDLIVGYGLSESPYGTVWPRGGPKPYGSIGRLRQHPTLGRINEARVVNQKMEPVASGNDGVLLLRNPAIMRGYFGLPEETAAVLRDGWLNTGDVVRMDDDGFFYFVGRSKEIIRRSGENFAPVEVEEVLDKHPSVAVSAVVPVSSPLFEDDAKAFVVLNTDTGDAVARESLARELLEWCRGSLAVFKLPRYIEFVTALPMTQTNRIAKGGLARTRTDSEIDLEALRKSVHKNRIDPS